MGNEGIRQSADGVEPGTIWNAGTPDETTLYDFSQDQPDFRAGLHFNVVNNVWAANFVPWADDDVRFVFTRSRICPESGRNLGRRR